MKTKAKSVPKPARRTKKAVRESAPASTPQARTVPRCTRCGSRTVRLEQFNQELLAVLAIHCLICGHHAFVGKPMVRLIRKPEIPQSADIQKEALKI
ncbi:hypothetical protein [Candidatus Nitronereus thalassa]|uniref:Uncharacterized protein n=1 Tax=Candidatus Nitronereus thalassa TaxID=3020898 RepID=A0ABU3KC77_9BACT|nr:hypothetical protein [Candidatus Nitronereus thalassa]MDT7043782.1 hypothetical protein [Candidatus Nitronereus thalassa]